MHKKQAEFHRAQAALHKAQHEQLKAKHEATADDNVDKAQYAKTAAYHEAMCKSHEQHAADYEALAEAEKTAKPEFVSIGKNAEGVELFKRQEVAPAAAPATPAAPAAAASASGTGVEGLIKETTTGLVKTSLEMLKSDPTVQDEIRKMVLEGVRSALGDKMVPTQVRGTMPGAPPDDVLKHLQLVPRAGSAPLQKADVDPNLEDALAI